MKKEKALKRLNLEICENLHKDIKVKAALKNITMSEYVQRAIEEKIIKEKQYE